MNLIRQKVSHLYTDEPSALDEENEIKTVGAHSKHQKFMQTLVNSGKGLAEIQTAWHLYYQSLPDSEKHEVWQEFYSNHPKSVNYFQETPKNPKPSWISVNAICYYFTHISNFECIG